MLTQPSISKAPPEDPALDQARLFTLGLDHVRRLASLVWTDHNVHDPGITTLELLCYALTDLGYRATMPVEDLLASPSGNAEAMRNQFFTARHILTNAPLTELDYRKLLIDIEHVKNAWIEPATQALYADVATGTLHLTDPGTPGIRRIDIQGLYRVRVELLDDVVDPATIQEAIDAVKGRLHARRNLCEDFISVEVIEKQPFILCGELELEPGADVVEVHAQVLFQVQQYLAPPVYSYTLAEMLARVKPDGTRYTPDEIFDGPELEYGFIPDGELAAAELREEVRLSDVISIVMDIKGVRAVRDLIINPRDTNAPLPDRWVVKVEAGKQPSLDIEASRLVVYKRNLPIVARFADVEARFDELVQEVRDRLESDRSGEPNDLDVPLGRYRDLRSYHSFQNHFPAIYGLGENGLPGGSGDARRALALQLKGYLLFFDQLMADYCAQLAHVKDLFSTDETLERTYFHQVVESFKEWSTVYGAPPAGESVLQQIEQLDDMGDDGEQVERRNRFLDHLVARFAERFHEYAAVTASSLGARPRDLLRLKCDFLKSYDEISAGRGLGYDDLKGALWDTENVSGLEKRVARLVGMPVAARHDLGGPAKPLPAPGDPDPNEGMLLIENLLLRTPDWQGPHLPICADPTCVDCAGADPYSYRVHVLLPAYAVRFGGPLPDGVPEEKRPVSGMDFRRFVEEVIRQEMPAHIVPKVCWVSREDMAAVEKAYHKWLVVRSSGASGDLGGRLNALIQELYRVKNVYPTERLRECLPGDEKPKFQLGRTALGSVDEDGGGGK